MLTDIARQDGMAWTMTAPVRGAVRRSAPESTGMASCGWFMGKNGIAVCLVLALACLGGFSPAWAQGQPGPPGSEAPATLESLEKQLRPGRDALARVMPELDAMAEPMSRDVLDGKADLHVFYGMVLARVLYEQCQDTLSLMRSAALQECPALQAGLAKRLGDAAVRLEGAAALIAGSLPMTMHSRVGIVGHATVKALEMYVAPLKAYAQASGRQDL